MSDKKILFEVTEDHLETGLRGIPVGYCTTSKVDPQKGLFYGEYSIAELVDWDPERVIHLLYAGRNGNDNEVDEFKHLLHARSACDPKVIKQVYELPRDGHPMALFSTAILLLGMYESVGDYREDCLNLIAKIPHLTTAVINHHAGWGKTAHPKPHLRYMENFFSMLNLPEGSGQPEFSEVLRLFNILHYDHGGGNLSAFVGKTVASGLEDLYGSISSAMNALAGPRHGRANQECLHFVERILKEVGEEATEADVERTIRDLLSRNELVYGFGHAVLRVEDARATVQYALAEKLYGDNPLVKIALLLRKAGPKVLKENPKIANPYPNVDAISGTLLTAAGFPYPQYYTVLFGLARVVGIAIQIVYERCEARDGKGTPIVRPKYIFKPRS